MKDKIFLIWSGDNVVAQKIKAVLEDRHNYVCFIGGNYANDSQMLSVGDTVIRQMKNCNQAIVLFQNKKDSGISNNLFFELGYVSASYGMKKVHCVKRRGDTVTLPSDFDNAFIESIDGKDDVEFVENIVKYFLSRQKLSVDTNKIHLINNRYVIHEMLQAHYSEVGSKCSDYELAQYVLFYQQAAVMFQDDAKVLDKLREFKQLHHSEFSLELGQAVNLSIELLEVQVGLVTENETTYLSDYVFRKYFGMCKDMVEDIRDDDSGTFDEWAKVFAAENLAYACSLYSLNPKISEDMVKSLCKKTICYGEQCIQLLERLESCTPIRENNDSVGLISVFKAYIYRHLFIACTRVQPENAEKWLNLSVKERKALLCTFDNNSIDSKIYSNFEMEYYLGLVEYLNYVDRAKIDDFDYTIYLNDLDSFISHLSSANSVNAYIKKILSNARV